MGCKRGVLGGGFHDLIATQIRRPAARAQLAIERFLAVTAGSAFADGLGHAVLNASWSTENGFYGRDRADQGMGTDCLNLFDFFTPNPADYDNQLCGFFSSFGANTPILIPNSPFSTMNRIEAGVDSNVTTLPAGYGFDRNPFRVLSVPTERFSFQTLLTRRSQSERFDAAVKCVVKQDASRRADQLFARRIGAQQCHPQR